MGNKPAKETKDQKMDRRIKTYFKDLNSDLQSSDMYQSFVSVRDHRHILENSQFLQDSMVFNSLIKDKLEESDFHISGRSIDLEQSEALPPPEPRPSATDHEKMKKNEVKAEEYNSKAKKFFKKEKYFKALKFYKKSFKIQQICKYTNNIARCFYKLDRPDASMEAMCISIFISPYNFENYRLAGIFSFHQFKKTRKMEDAYQCQDYLRNAWEIEANEKNNFNYFQVRKMIFLIKQRDLEDEKQELLSYLDSSHRFSREECSRFLKQTYFNRDNKSPKYLFCCITLDLMREPVITPMGYSYEKSKFLEWCQTAGCKDPMTNRLFWSMTRVVENKALKRYSERFIRMHPWAFESDIGNDDWTSYEFQ